MPFAPHHLGLVLLSNKNKSNVKMHTVDCRVRHSHTNQNQLIVVQVEPISLIDRQADKQFQGIYLLGTGSLQEMVLNSRLY